MSPAAGEEGSSCRLEVRVQPGAKRDALAGWHGGSLRVRVRAAAVEGAANRAMLRFLARELGLRRSRIRILRGHRHREKLLHIEGLDEAALRGRLREALEEA